MPILMKIFFFLELVIVKNINKKSNIIKFGHEILYFCTI